MEQLVKESPSEEASKETDESIVVTVRGDNASARDIAVQGEEEKEGEEEEEEEEEEEDRRHQAVRDTEPSTANAPQLEPPTASPAAKSQAQASEKRADVLSPSPNKASIGALAEIPPFKSAKLPANVEAAPETESQHTLKLTNNPVYESVRRAPVLNRLVLFFNFFSSA